MSTDIIFSFNLGPIKGGSMVIVPGASIVVVVAAADVAVVDHLVL